MALYFVPRQRERRRSSPEPITEGLHHHQIHSLDDSLFIFPTPSSAPPSPYLSSDVSVPTELSLSSLEDLRSRDRSAPSASPDITHPSLSVSSHTDVDSEPWDWSNRRRMFGDEQGSNGNRSERPARRESLVHHAKSSRTGQSHHARSSRADLRRRAKSHSPRRYTHRHNTPDPIVPYPRIHIPLLSIFLSFLTIDQATQHLLTHSTPESALFSGDSLYSDEPPAGDLSHGVAKLILLSRESQSVREGCEVIPLPPHLSYLRFTLITASSFKELVDQIRDVVMTVKDVRKVSSEKLLRFCVDIALISLSIRTAYLVDALPVREPERVCILILTALRQRIPDFENTTLFHEASSGQMFFVNLPLLRETLSSLRECSSGTEIPTTWFVRLDDPPVLLPSCPENLMEALAEINGAVSASIVCQNSPLLPASGQFGLDVAVPLAAVLLEYPVAYVPNSPDQITFLSGLPLYVYEAILHEKGSTTIHQGHSLLKFSAPCGVSSTCPALMPSNIIKTIKTRYEARLLRRGCPLSLTVQHVAQTFDRVAL